MPSGFRGCYTGASIIRRILFLFSIILSICLVILVLHFGLSAFHTQPLERTNKMITSSVPGMNSLSLLSKGNISQLLNPMFWAGKMRTDPVVLVVYKKKSNPTHRQVRKLLEAQRVDHHFYMISPFKTPALVRFSFNTPFPIGRYAVIVIVDVMGFIMEDSVWQLFIDYCNSYKAGMVLVAAGLTKSYSTILKWKSPTGVQMTVQYPHLAKMQYIQVSNSSSMLHVLKDGGKWTKFENESLFITFKAPNEEKSFEPIMVVQYSTPSSNQFLKEPIALLEYGRSDGVSKVYIGSPLTVTLSRLVFLDALKHLTKHSPVLKYSLDRLILIDIDDIFVAPKGQKMTFMDVKVCCFFYFS